MTILRTLALLALFGSTTLVPRAHAIPFGPIQPTASDSAAALNFDAGSDRRVPPSAEIPSVFASAPIPIGDASWSLRPFTLTGATVQPYAIQVVPDAPSPTPEPAGLFLLGTGAFATALTIRYRLFSL